MYHRWTPQECRDRLELVTANVRDSAAKVTPVLDGDIWAVVLWGSTTFSLHHDGLVSMSSYMSGAQAGVTGYRGGGELPATDAAAQKFERTVKKRLAPRLRAAVQDLGGL